MSEFQGIYAPFIQKYINFKRSLGYRFQNKYLFMSFANFTVENGVMDIGLTKELCDKWQEKRPHESDATRYKRVNDIRNFSIYLNQLGYPSYIPAQLKYRSNFTPYIFSAKEIKRFFEACDSLEITPCSNITYMLPALFRMIYGCGLRITEALQLRCKDVCLDERNITIRKSKNGRERILPLSDSLTHVLVQYVNSHLSKYHTADDYFFAKKNGEQCSGASVYIWFRKILFNAGISHGGRGAGPRLHDVRHSFSVHSLKAMSEAGMDLYYSLPILSNYLGHQSLEATDKYVRLTSDMYPELIQNTNKLCEYVFPEVNKK